MELVIGWLVFSFVAAWVWSARGLSFGTGLVVSLLLSPVVGIIVGLVKTPTQATLDQRQLAAGDKRKCPFCAELIRREANICRYCGKDVSDGPINQTGIDRRQAIAQIGIERRKAWIQRWRRDGHDYSRPIGQSTFHAFCKMEHGTLCYYCGRSENVCILNGHHLACGSCFADYEAATNKSAAGF